MAAIFRTPCTQRNGASAIKMGLQFGLDTSILKRKFRWLFSIPDVSADKADALPPRKSARPGITFKEFEFQHISETIWYPLKAEWKPINIVLYDLKCNKNPVFDWFSKLYQISHDNQRSTEPVNFNKVVDVKFKRSCILELYDGCGKVLETWIYENAYPQSIDWGELDMDSNEIVTVDLSLRYDRAFFVSA